MVSRQHAAGRQKRRANEVDKLERKILEIQLKCQHRFALVPFEENQSPRFRGSCVEGVFIREDENGVMMPLEVKCEKCNDRRWRSDPDECPRCLGTMQKGALEPRERYYGKARLHYACRLYSCSECGFVVVSDEYQRELCKIIIA
jgi:hypothetical protein